MKRITAVILSVVFASSAFAATETQRYQVATRTAIGAAHIGTLIRDIEGTTSTTSTSARNIVTFQSVNGFAADLTADEAAALSRSADVVYVEPAVERHAFGLPTQKTTDTDKLNPLAQTVPFGVDLVRARDVWPVTRGEGVNVVVVDTGVDFNHPELVAAYAGGYNTLDTANPPMDDNDHGTHVSGTIAAADNSFGVVGVAPGVKLWAVKVLDASGSGTSDHIIQAIDWVIGKKTALGGNWIMNFSLGSSSASGLERSAFGRATDAGIIVCAASGNESSATLPAPIDYPAGYANVLAIGAVDSTKTIASFSNQGPGLAVVGPGVSVLSTVPVGAGSSVSVTTGTTSLSAASMTGSALGTVTGNYVFCGYGTPSEIPASVNGKIALIQRGNGVFFYDKVKNTKDAGAVAAVIFNNGGDFSAGFTLQSTDQAWTQTYSFPIAVMIDTADGAALRANPNQTITVTYKADDYDVYSGTSMATPHAVGVAALVWGAAPNDTATQIRAAMLSTAGDLGASGFDNVYGNGLLDALNAAKSVAPAKFGNGGTPAP
ncbi:MAG TPA: S8 family serine peptidase, partial [Thermoanaerobaculia bacterium]